MMLMGFVYLDYVQKVWLDKSKGKICMSIASNGLAITGIDDRRYWSRIPTEESRWGFQNIFVFINLIRDENWDWIHFYAYDVYIDFSGKSNFLGRFMVTFCYYRYLFSSSESLSTYNWLFLLKSLLDFLSVRVAQWLS